MPSRLPADDSPPVVAWDAVRPPRIAWPRGKPPGPGGPGPLPSRVRTSDDLLGANDPDAGRPGGGYEHRIRVGRRIPACAASRPALPLDAAPGYSRRLLRPPR